MAAPFALALAALGGMLGYAIPGGYWLHKGTPAMLSIVFLFTAGVPERGTLAKLQPETFEVRTAIEVNAPPEKVWNQVVAFAEIPPPKELLFRAGLPIRSGGDFPGTALALSALYFSTGPFAEPIEVWDEPRLLKFGVTENPAPLNELSPYGNISRRICTGTLFPSKAILADGATRRADAARRPTWYQQTMWPRRIGIYGRTTLSSDSFAGAGAYPNAG